MSTRREGSDKEQSWENRDRECETEGIELVCESQL